MSDIVSELLDRAYSHRPNDFLCERAAMEIERLRLTAEEREAIEWAVGALVGIEDFSPGAVSADARAADSLRNLLERLK